MTSAPARKAFSCGSHPHAAEHRGAREPRVDGELLEVLVDLRGQLARGGQDERARRSARLADETVQDRQEEGGGLAATGRGGGHEVPPGHDGRDRLVLDGGRALEALVLDRAEQVGVQHEA